MVHGQQKQVVFGAEPKQARAQQWPVLQIKWTARFFSGEPLRLFLLLWRWRVAEIGNNDSQIQFFADPLRGLAILVIEGCAQ